MDPTPLVFSSIENIQISQTGSSFVESTSMISLSSTQVGSNTLVSSGSSSPDVDTEVPFSTSIVIPDATQPSPLFTNPTNSSYPTSPVSTMPSATKVRFILIGVLTFLSGFILFPMILKKMCSRDRRRRLTIRLIRKPSDSSLHRKQQPASPASFFVGDKSVEGGLSARSILGVAGERRLSCAHSAGLAGIGTNKLDYTRYHYPAFPERRNENSANLNFDNPYGTPTYIIGRGYDFASSPSYAAHLPKKSPRLLELPSFADNHKLSATQCHTQVISKPSPVPLKRSRAVSPARTKSGVSSWLKNGSLPSSALLYSDSHSRSSNRCDPRPSEKSMANNLDYTHQPVNHNQNLLRAFSPHAYMNRSAYQNQSSSGNSVMNDTKRNGCMISLKEALPVSAQNRVMVTEKAPCNVVPPPAAIQPSPRSFTNAKMEKAPGIAF